MNWAFIKKFHDPTLVLVWYWSSLLYSLLYLWRSDHSSARLWRRTRNSLMLLLLGLWSWTRCRKVLSWMPSIVLSMKVPPWLPRSFLKHISNNLSSSAIYESNVSSGYCCRWKNFPLSAVSEIFVVLKTRLRTSTMSCMLLTPMMGRLRSKSWASAERHIRSIWRMSLTWWICLKSQ